MGCSSPTRRVPTQFRKNLIDAEINREQGQVIGGRRVVGSTRLANQTNRSKVVELGLAGGFDRCELGGRPTVDGDDHPVTRTGPAEVSGEIASQFAHAEMNGPCRWLHRQSITRGQRLCTPRYTRPFGTWSRYRYHPAS